MLFVEYVLVGAVLVLFIELSFVLVVELLLTAELVLSVMFDVVVEYWPLPAELLLSVVAGDV
jgi:hypothetical protein